MRSEQSIILLGTTASSIYTFRSDLIKTLIKLEWEVYAFVSEYTLQELAKIESLGAIPITYKMNRGGLNPLSDLRAMWQLKKLIKEIQPQIVFSYFAKPVVYGTIASKLAKVPKIVGMLEGLGYTFTDQPEGKSFKTKVIQKLQVLLYKISIPLLDQLFLLNPDDKKDLIDKYKIRSQSTTILGGIGLNLEEYKFTTPHSSINFLFIGRLLKEKGIFDFIEATRIVKKQYPMATFTILGSIDKQNMGALNATDLNELIHNDLIQYPGQVEDVRPWIENCSVFVLPSYREGVPRSTQEAMAMGRAVITTDVPGCRETVVNNINGFIVPKWDPQSLADKMIYFIQNPDKISIMGKQSYQMAIEKFDAEKINNKLLDILMNN